MMKKNIELWNYEKWSIKDFLFVCLFIRWNDLSTIVSSENRSRGHTRDPKKIKVISEVINALVYIVWDWYDQLWI